jgi:hypothetical protein
MEADPTRDRDDDHGHERGEQNELGYRNVDEQGEHDEAGSQGEGPEPPPDE